jgi:hypothetical protein
VRRHSADPVALLAGVVFVVVGAAYLSGALTDSDVQARWILPGVLIALGLGGLLATLLNMARQRRQGPGEAGDETAVSSHLGPAQPERPGMDSQETASSAVTHAQPGHAAPPEGPDANSAATSTGPTEPEDSIDTAPNETRG